jgi:hypothetical protein
MKSAHHPITISNAIHHLDLISTAIMHRLQPSLRSILINAKLTSHSAKTVALFYTAVEYVVP